MRGKTRLANYWVVTRPDGSNETVYSLRRFSIENGLIKQAMLRTCPGDGKHRQSHHRGYKCRPATPQEIETCRKLNPNVEQYKSKTRAAREERRALRSTDINGEPKFVNFVREISEGFEQL
jgi:hypothetical protein